MGAHQVKGCDVVGVGEAAPLPGDVQIEAFAWALACIVHLTRARVEAIPPTWQSLSVSSREAEQEQEPTHISVQNAG